MLYRFHSNILIIGLLLIGFLAVMTAERSFCVMTYSTIFAFVSQQFLLIYFSNTKERKYTDRALFFTVLIYSILLGAIFMSVSYYYSGDTFMLTKTDAWFYYQEGMKTVNIGFFENAGRIMRKYHMDDWGALITSSFLLSIVPSKLFVNALYILAGAASVVMIYRIGNYFMPNEYAFEAALAYGTSSFMVFFYCSYLKEALFIFYVVSAIYFFYMAVFEKKKTLLAVTILCLFIIVFYRPAIAAFIVISLIGYYAIAQKGSAWSFFLYIIIVMALAVSMTFLQEQVDRFAGVRMEGEAGEDASANYSDSTNIMVSWVVGLLGPFPTLFPMLNIGPESTNFYGAGLTYRLFIMIPFWIGIIYAIVRRNVKMAPFAIFVIMEIIAGSYILASFELRKIILHVPFMFIISFYGIYQLEQSVKLDPYKKWIELAGYAMAIGFVFIWNIIREKG